MRPIILVICAKLAFFADSMLFASNTGLNNRVKHFKCLNMPKNARFYCRENLSLTINLKYYISSMLIIEMNPSAVTILQDDIDTVKCVWNGWYWYWRDSKDSKDQYRGSTIKNSWRASTAHKNVGRFISPKRFTTRLYEFTHMAFEVAGQDDQSSFITNRLFWINILSLFARQIQLTTTTPPLRTVFKIAYWI